MTELKATMITKNFRVQDVVELTGYGSRMVEKFMSGDKPTPKMFLDAVKLEPVRESNGMMRRAFIALLEELEISPQQASTILVKHVDRIEKMANPGLSMDKRVAITSDDVKKLREHDRKKT
jgi:hypothetical protein